MKYEKEYIETNNRTEFLELFKERYPKLSVRTGMRHYSRLKKELNDLKIEMDVTEEINETIENPKKTFKYEAHEKTKPAQMKIMAFDDMKRYGKLSKNNLKKNGFSPQEIRWLEDHKDWTKLILKETQEEFISKAQGVLNMKDISEAATKVKEEFSDPSPENIPFTQDELFEIEKIADHYAGHTLQKTIDNIAKFEEFGKNAKKLQSEFLKNSTEVYDMMRSISAKCQKIRKK